MRKHNVKKLKCRTLLGLILEQLSSFWHSFGFILVAFGTPLVNFGCFLCTRSCESYLGKKYKCAGTRKNKFQNGHFLVPLLVQKLQKIRKKCEGALVALTNVKATSVQSSKAWFWSNFGSFWHPFGSILIAFGTPLDHFGCIGAPFWFNFCCFADLGVMISLLGSPGFVIWARILRWFTYTFYVWLYMAVYGFAFSYIGLHMAVG